MGVLLRLVAWCGLAMAVGGVIATASGAPVASARTIPGPRTFNPTGAQQVYTVPANVTLVEADVNGANGGGGDLGMPLGAYLPVTGHETLYAEVGVNGTYAGGKTFGGGGAAGAIPLSLGTAPCTGIDAVGSCGGALAGSGGGASDVRTCSELVARCPGGGTSAASRLEVAGGGAGAGGTGETPGWYCTQLPQKGNGYNPQIPLPGGSAAQGPVPVVTKAGIVIPGEPADHTYGVIKDITASQGGSTKPGAGGTLGTCSVYETNNGSIVSETYGGSLRGAAGSGSSGGAGASVTGHFAFETPGNSIPGSGGGGGGGYTGGGGGSTGDVCTYSVKGPPCNDPSGGMGGGGGSSFVAKRVLGPFVQDGPASGPSITFTPIVEIDRPANGAVYSPGQVVDASWQCGHYQGTSCSGAIKPGSPIDTQPGKHSFTVEVSLYPTNKVVASTVSYTVRAGGGSSTAAAGGGSAATIPPPTATTTGTVTVNGAAFTSGRIRFGSTADLTHGEVTLKTTVGTLHITGAAGITAAFTLLGTTVARKAVVELRLTKGNFSICPTHRTAGARGATGATTIIRQLWGNGKGDFQTRGRFAAATVRGTDWLTADRCDGTLARVVRGVVQVSDLVKHTTVSVPAGHSYLAKP